MSVYNPVEGPQTLNPKPYTHAKRDFDNGVFDGVEEDPRPHATMQQSVANCGHGGEAVPEGEDPGQEQDDGMAASSAAMGSSTTGTSEMPVEIELPAEGEIAARSAQTGSHQTSLSHWLL